MYRLALLPLTALVGCIIIDGDDCDAMAVGSVGVSVSAADGGDVSEAVVSWSSDGTTYASCDAFPDDGEFVCGWEYAGAVSVRVEAVGYETFEETVFVEQGECHVRPEHVDAVLQPGVDCTTEERVSVVATVAGAGGEELSGVQVSWGYRDADMAPQPCDTMDDGYWACGYEVAGDLEIYAEADGHAGQMEEVHVRSDECHVLTETVDFVLEWLPD